MEQTILAVDVGTSSLKAVVYAQDGGLLATSTQRYDFQSEKPGWAEGDPEAWWQALGDALSDLNEQGQELDRVQAVSFTGQMHTAVLLDGAGEVLAPTILWLDRRAAAETHDLQAELALPPYQLNSTYTLPKLLWLHRYRPEVLARTRILLWPKDYLRYRLTGEVCTDLTEPGGAALLDWDTRSWALERLALVGLDPSVLPPIRRADGDGGLIRHEVAHELGLNADARVVVGMGDVAALFGAAPPRTGRVTCSLGSSSMVFAPLATGQEVLDPEQQLYTYPFGPYPMLGGVSSTSGSSLVWAYETFGQGRELTFEAFVRRAAEVEAGAEGLSFVPYLAGERSPFWSDEIRAGFHGLRLSHGPDHMGRAVMEGVAYSLRHLLDIYAELGVSIDEIALAGGGASTTGWPQVIADACQRDVLIYTETETVTRVLYALCQAHLDRQRFEEALLQTFDEPGIIQHSRQQARPYEEAYGRYRALARFAREQARAGD